MALAKAVANATAALVLKAKGVASRCDSQADQNKVIGAATHCALATSQLVACTKVRAVLQLYNNNVYKRIPQLRADNLERSITEAHKLCSWHFQ